MTWAYVPSNFSPGLGADALPLSCSVTRSPATSSVSPTASVSSSSASATACCQMLPSGMTCARFQRTSSADRSAWCVAAFPASHSVQRPTVAIPPTISGPSCSMRSEASTPCSCSQKTSNERPSKRPLKTLLHVDIAQPLESLQPPDWVRRMTDRDGGYLPTPTAKANHDAPSMRKWPAYETYQRWLAAFGARTEPRIWEWMMGFPIGWTDCAPLATDRFRSWRRAHSFNSERG